MCVRAPKNCPVSWTSSSPTSGIEDGSLTQWSEFGVRGKRAGETSLERERVAMEVRLRDVYGFSTGAVRKVEQAREIEMRELQLSGESQVSRFVPPELGVCCGVTEKIRESQVISIMWGGNWPVGISIVQWW